MGLAKGIFMVDSHVHAQRHSMKFKEKGLNPAFDKLADGMTELEAWDNSSRLLYYMDRYGVDMSIIQVAYGMTNEIDEQIVKNHPDRFAALARDVHTQHKCLREGKPWTIEVAVQELDELLSTDLYVGIGEGIPRNRDPKRKKIGWNERFDQICQVMELGRKYKVPVQYHTGFPSGYAGAIDLAKEQGHYTDSEWANPLLCHEVAACYPDVNIILAHAGIEGSGYYTEYYDKCLNVAAAHNNVYLETGMWWAELYYKPLKDPSIGAEKLMWGTDWGASSTPQVWTPGEVPETFCSQNVAEGPPAYQVNVFAWSLRELGRLNIPQDDLDLILGGNAVRVLGLKTPFTRLFREPRNKHLFTQKEPKKK